MICVRTKSLHITLEGDQHFCYSTRGSCLQREEFKRRHFKQTVFFLPLLVFGNDLGYWLFFVLHMLMCVMQGSSNSNFVLFFLFFNKKMNNKIEKAFFVLLLLQFLIRHLLLYPFSTCTNGGTTVIVLEVFALSATYSS